MSTFSVQSSVRQTDSLFQYLPLVNPPALKENPYAPNDPLIRARAITGVALSFIALATLNWLCPPIALLAAKYETLSIYGSIGLSLLPWKIESYRAEQAADQKAVDAYINESTPSTQATERLLSSPTAFQLFLNQKGDLNKLNSQGISLARKIVQEGDAEVRRMLVHTEIDFLSPRPEGSSLFMQAVESFDSSFLSSLLASGKVQASNLTELDQAKMWKKVKKEKTVELLAAYGFNIQARDQAGNTPLMHWTQNDQRLSLSVVALNAGANPHLENNQGKKPSQVVSSGSVLHALLLQAEKSYGKGCGSLPKEKGWLSWLPWRPLVVKDSLFFRADTDRLANRVYAVGIAAIALLFLTPPSFVGIVAPVVMSLTVATLPYFLLGWIRGEKEAKRQAVVDFLTSPVPSKQSIYTICRSKEAARLLVEHASPDTLNKLDRFGHPLLGKEGMDLETFQSFLDKGANVLAGDTQSGLFLAVQKRDLRFLASILDKGVISPQSLSPDLQMKLWTSIGSVEAGHLLIQKGFHPDVQDEEGNTALMDLARRGAFLNEVPLAKIKMLLELGAKKDLVNHENKTAKDLAKDPRVQALL